jgi:hypothetical protein
MAATHSGEVREDGERLAELAGLHCELRRQGKNSLVHLGSDERDLMRRVRRLNVYAENQIFLKVPRFGRAKSGRLDFLRRDSRRSIPVISARR